MVRVVAIIPHPDDETYGFGGTLALAARAGWDCHVVALTSGEGGERHDAPLSGPAVLRDLRESELAASCQLLGCHPPRLLRFPDGRLAEAQEAARAALEEALSTLRPDLVFALGPDGAYGHPDHLAAWRLASSIWQAADRPYVLLFPAFPPGLFRPQYEKCLAVGVMGDRPAVSPADLGVASPHYRVPIAGAAAQRKIEAIAAHRSQLPAGDPRALFPPGIVDALLDEERFADASGHRSEEVARLLATLPAAEETFLGL